MRPDEPIEMKFERAFSVAAPTSPVFSYQAKQQMGKMVETIARANENMQGRLNTNQHSSVKGGFLAEEFHAETFNLDATLKGKDLTAVTDQYKSEWTATGKSGNDTADLLILKDGKPVSSAQAKYYRNAETTNREMSQLGANGNPKYQDMDTLLGPSDQVNPTDGSVSVGEHADAAAYGNKARGGDPAQTDAYRQTSEKVSVKIEHEGVSSTKLSKSEADALGQGDLAKIKQIESRYQARSTLQQVGNAAAMSAIVSGSINIVRYIQMARDGKLSADEAVIKIVAETAASAADSAVKSGAVVGTQSLLVRYGSEKVLISTLARQSFTSLARTNAVTVGVVCAVDAVKDMVALGMGKLTREEFFERQGKGLLNTSSGVVGGTLGAVATESALMGLGLSGGMLVPLVGGLAGGLIAGLAMQLAVENHIDKPYRELIENTKNLRSAAQELQQLSRSVFGCQVLFTKVIERDNELELLFCQQLTRIDAAGQRARAAINKI